MHFTSISNKGVLVFAYSEAIQRDPIVLARAYSEPRDQEVIAFLASCLAYGKVTQFLPRTWNWGLVSTTAKKRDLSGLFFPERLCSNRKRGTYIKSRK
jgi:hypothetical protein